MSITLAEQIGKTEELLQKMKDCLAIYPQAKVSKKGLFYFDKLKPSEAIDVEIILVQHKMYMRSYPNVLLKYNIDVNNCKIYKAPEGSNIAYFTAKDLVLNKNFMLIFNKFNDQLKNKITMKLSELFCLNKTHNVMLENNYYNRNDYTRIFKSKNPNLIANIKKIFDINMNTVLEKITLLEKELEQLKLISITHPNSFVSKENKVIVKDLNLKTCDGVDIFICKKYINDDYKRLYINTYITQNGVKCYTKIIGSNIASIINWSNGFSLNYTGFKYLEKHNSIIINMALKKLSGFYTLYKCNKVDTQGKRVLKKYINDIKQMDLLK